jgi:GNAT superfamily N-acetyltransferase
VDSFWASYYGVSPEELRAPEARVVAHAGLAGYRGLQGFVLLGGGLLVSAPPEQVEMLARHVAGWRLESLLDLTRLVELGLPAGAAVGPAFLGYTDSRHFKPTPSLAVRRLERGDRQSFEELREACDPEEWDHGGGAFELPSAGWFEDGRVLAVAHYEVWGGAIAHVGVVAEPGARGAGRGHAVVSAITGVALAEGLVPQYRTLETNAPSLKVASDLGFEAYARTVSVRLTAG